MAIIAQPDIVRMRRAPLSERIKRNWPFIVATIILVLLVGLPLIQVLHWTVRTGYPGRMLGWTLENYRQALTGSITYYALLNTFALAAITTAISVTLGTLFAWLVERTDMPLRSTIWAALLAPMALPGILFVLAWTFMLSPKAGLINLVLRVPLEALGFSMENGPFNIYSFSGLVFIDSMRGVTTVFLMMVGAFRLFDPTLEEAASAAGAGLRTTVFRITLPALAPAILAAAMYCFIGNMDQFESALAIGLQGGVFLLSTLVFFTVQMRTPINYGLGSVYAVIFMVIMLVLVYFYRKVAAKSERFVTVTGKGYRPRRIPLGNLKYVFATLIAIYGLVAVILPTVVLVWSSLLPPFAAVSFDGDAAFSLKNYTNLLSDDRILGVAWHTLTITVCTATVTMLIAFLISWSIVRSQARGKALLDSLSFFSHALPGVTIAIGLIFAFLNPPLNALQLYGSIWVIVIGLTIQYMAFGTRLMNGAVVQIQRELEDAGQVCGAPSLAVMYRITLPLLMPSFVAGWIWVAAHAIRSFSVPLVLSSQRNEVIAARIWGLWSDGRFNEASALGVMLLIILFPLSFLMRRAMSRTEG